MGSNSHRNYGDRKEILRGVYEDNVRTTREEHRTSKPKSLPEDPTRPKPRRFRIPPNAYLLVGIVLVLASALTAKHLDQPVETSAADSVRTPLPMNFATADRSPNAPIADPRERGNPITAPKGQASTVTPSLETPLFGTFGTPSVADLYGLHLETIVIDAGHGGEDPGAIGAQGLQEKDVTLDIARRLRERLQRQSGYRILLTRDGEQSMELRERIEFANANEADLFISIHVNWLPVDSIAPIETYYYGPNSDARALSLAQRENKNSGYSLAEFNDVTQSLGIDLKIQESREAAHSIQEGLIDGLRTMGRDVNDWGAKSGDFMVLLGVDAPSILAEIGSLSNPEDESKLFTVSYREKLAYILAEGIANYLELHQNENAHFRNGSQEDKEGV